MMLFDACFRIFECLDVLCRKRDLSSIYPNMIELILDSAGYR